MRQKTISAILIMLLFSWTGCAKKVTLHQAAAKGSTNTVQSLINEGAGVDERKEFGITPLMAAAKTNNFKVIRKLLENGADINAKDNFRLSALWYAYDYESFDAFKLLLENGASLDFPLSFKTASTIYKKKKLYRLAKEYTWLRRIRRTGGDLNLYAAYFSEFPNGYYISEVIKTFSIFVKRDYDKIKYSGSVGKLQRFLNKYSNLGNNCYTVTASVLNIRSGASVNTGKSGEYKKGDRICAVEDKSGWIRTDIGWVSRKYTKPALINIPIIRSYTGKVKDKLRKIEQEKINQARKTEIEAEKKEIEDRIAKAQNELDSLTKKADLSKIEEFINKYENNKEYRSIVENARKKYKAILLGD
ncbi:MAG: ankyrin repeat domain-containing protein [Desulfobacteraceae bacterium]|nr:ankyrin repeat domain-containing protein [Desulfobacteraceae bacterium]